MVYTTSSAVTVFPLWKVTPSRSLTVHTVAVLLGTADTASPGMKPSGPGATRNSGSYSCSPRMRSVVVTSFRGSTVSDAPPEIIAMVSVPPLIGVPLLLGPLERGAVPAMVVPPPPTLPPHPASHAPAARAAAPSAPRLSRSRRVRSCSSKRSLLTGRLLTVCAPGRAVGDHDVVKPGFLTAEARRIVSPAGR